MDTPILKKHHLPVSLILAIASVITACDKNPAPKVSITQSAKTFPATTLLQGAVSNKKGLLHNGNVDLNDAQNRTIASTPLINGHYELEIPANTPLPVILSVDDSGGPLLVAIVDPTINHYDINPLTTAIAQKAKTLGGYTRANMIVAAESMINAPDANKTSTGFRGDPTTQYGGWH
jgi:hypothetical protein